MSAQATLTDKKVTQSQIVEEIFTSLAVSRELRGIKLRGVNRIVAHLRGVNLITADFRSANLIYADLRNAYLNGSYLNSADLRSAVEQLFTNHLTDSRWRKLFLLLAETPHIDAFIKIMEEQIQTYVTTPKLQRLLAWSEQIIDTSPNNIKPVGKRVIAISLALSYAKAYAKAYDYANAHDYSQVLDYNNALANLLANAYAHTYSLAIANVLAIVLGNAYAKNYALANAKALQDFILYVKKLKKFGVYESRQINNLLDKLRRLKEQVPAQELSIKIHRYFANQIIQTVLQAFQLTTEMIDLSPEEIQALENYFYANKLIMDCQKVSSHDSQRIWEQIEARMLLPKSSWEKLKPSSHSIL